MGTSRRQPASVVAAKFASARAKQKVRDSGYSVYTKKSGGKTTTVVERKTGSSSAPKEVVKQDVVAPTTPTRTSVSDSGTSKNIADAITIQRGDTLSGLAKQYDMSIQDIVGANLQNQTALPDSTNPNLIIEGARLNIPQLKREPTILSSDKVAMETRENLELTRMSSEALAKHKEEISKKKEEAEVDLFEEDLSDEEVELRTANLQLDTMAKEAINILNDLRLDLGEANNTVIEGMRTAMTRRLEEMKEFNKNVLAGQKILGITSGRSRYAPVVQAGIISGEESAGLRRLQLIEEEGLSLIAQAELAVQTKDYEMLSDIQNKRLVLQQDKVEALQAQVKLQREKDEEILEAKQKTMAQLTASELYASGVTDPGEIFMQMVEGGFETIDMMDMIDVIDSVSGGETGDKAFDKFFPEGSYEDYLRFQREEGAAKRAPKDADEDEKDSSLRDYVLANPGLSKSEYIEWADKNAPGLSVGQVEAVIEDTQTLKTLGISPSQITDSIISNLEIGKRISGSDKEKIDKLISNIKFSGKLSSKTLGTINLSDEEIAQIIEELNKLKGKDIE